jgi:L-alanine-DL-glutamate epimerase-like enolase superfamily enzyme
MKYVITRHSLPLAREFRISRGAKTHANVVRLRIDACGFSGHSECVPYGRYGESVASVSAAINDFLTQWQMHISRLLTDVVALNDTTLLTDFIEAKQLKGAAANAVDCALWDWFCKRFNESIFTLLELPENKPALTAQTLSLGSLDDMLEQAYLMRDVPLIKIKFDATDVVLKMQKIAEICPHSEFILDANEAWSITLLNQIVTGLTGLKVRLIEQPLPADDDDDMHLYRGKIPICADESCHTSYTFAPLVGKYQAINIKLDKTGGFTEALRLIQLAQAARMQIMLGCMVGSSLAMAPNRVLAGYADVLDLDGPVLVAQDIEDGYSIDNGLISTHSSRLWG